MVKIGGRLALRPRPDADCRAARSNGGAALEPDSNDAADMRPRPRNAGINTGRLDMRWAGTATCTGAVHMNSRTAPPPNGF